jgi:hypothetical protein
MKKSFSVLIVLIMLLSLLSACADASVREYEPTPTVTPRPEGVHDFKAAYESMDPDTVVFTIGKDKIYWDELFYWINSSMLRIESQFGAMPLDDMLTEDESFAEFIMEDVKTVIVQFYGLNKELEKLGIGLSDESKAQFEEIKKANMERYCGGQVSDEEFFNALSELLISERVYKYVSETSLLHQDGFAALYGPGGEKFSADKTLAFAEERGYMRAMHVLFSFENPDGSQKIDAEKLNLKKEAEALVSELRKIGAKDKLTEEFKKRVLERGEDPGAAHLIDGYYFTEGKMVPAFEEAVKAAEMYKVTDPVETEFGLHVILRLPLEADGVLDYYTARTLRSDAAYFDYNKKIESFTEMYELKESDAMKDFDLLKIFGEDADSVFSPGS